MAPHASAPRSPPSTPSPLSPSCAPPSTPSPCATLLPLPCPVYLQPPPLGFPLGLPHGLPVILFPFCVSFLYPIPSCVTLSYTPFPCARLSLNEMDPQMKGGVP